MKNDSPEIYNCEFAPEIIDFLYGEISGERKNAFNLHLRNCFVCADEVADFSELRFSIQDWKADFDKIKTPEIVIPYKNPANVKIVETRNKSWLENLRNYLNFSPMLSGAAAILILALMVGLGFFVFGNYEGGELIATGNENTEIKNNLIETPINVVGQNKEKADNFVKDFKNIDSAADVTTQRDDKVIKDLVPVKIYNKPNAKQKSQTAKTLELKSRTADSSVKNTKSKNAIPSKNKPRLNELPEEDADNSLRLADLFAELDTRD